MRLVRQVAKALLRRPWYAAALVVVTAVGFALLISVLAIVDGVLFKPLAYADSDRLVLITQFSPSSSRTTAVSKDDLARWSQPTDATLTGFAVSPLDTTASSTGMAVVQSNFFDVIGVRPAAGGFTAEDFGDSKSNIEPRIVTDEIFRSQFGGDATVIGRVVMIDPSIGYGYRIVGVMPPGFVFPAKQWSVGFVTTHAGSRRFARFNHVIARLARGATGDQLRAQVSAAIGAGAVEAAGPANSAVVQARVEPLGAALSASSRPLFTAVFVGVSLLVAIGALNASSLMAARSIDRAREVSLRRALGASMTQVAQLVLIESFLVIGTGALIGVALAAPLLRLVADLLPRELALFKVVSIDARVGLLGFVATALFASVVAFWPLRLVKEGSHPLGPTRGVTSFARSRSWWLVTTAQVSLALVLTVGGSLLVSSLLSVYARPPAISSERVLAISLRFQGATANQVMAERASRANALVERLKNLPGVEAAAVTAYELLDQAYVRSWFLAPATAANPRQAMMTQAATADYYRIVRPQLVSGRWPNEEELANSAPVVVASETVARNYWPDASAIGQTIVDKGPEAVPRPFTVVGVVKDVRWFSWDSTEALAMIYGPFDLLARQGSAVALIKTSQDPSQIAKEALRSISETDPLIRVGRAAPLADLFIDSVRPRRLYAWVFGLFSTASLLIVGIGIFGQLAMSTARRTREVGIRITCGASRGGILRLVLREQLLPVVVGIAVGTVAATWSVSFVQSYLYEVTSSNPLAWVSAIALIVSTAVVGTLAPALRASRVDPSTALRSE